MAFNISELDFIFPNDWKLVRLGDIAKINAGSITKKDKFDFIKYIDISSVSTHSFQKPNILNFNDAPSRARRKLKDNDFIISTVRPNLRQYAFLNKVEENWIASTGFCVVSADNETLAWYLYSLVTSEIFTNYLVRVADGGAYPAFNPKEIEDAIIPLPNPNDLKIISSLAKDIYHKIELNTQINQTLEQIAQTIFKSWFIDFDPVHAKANALASGQTAEQATQVAMAVISGKNTQELHRLQTANPKQYQQLWEIAEAFPRGVDEEGVPWGWEERYLKDVCNIVYGKGLPKNKLTEKGFYVFGANGVIGFYDSYTYEKPQVLIGCRGTVGQVTLSYPYSFVTNNSLVIEYENSCVSMYYLEKYLSNINLKEISSGSVQPQITIQNMSKVKILIPNIEILNFYSEKVKEIYDKRLHHFYENQSLSKVRDLLLPKLLSGEV
ncbi:restriction endonuclease subunit S [Glaesserella parasuis]|uniref:restriction endonuclease subunit S n=1 Tax=Glaesserella parasuis TaxID=738 RepID=UPI002436C5C2|nr:restriction endonuclease subunit S [Glaesserella parasuis]MDG6245147.1 restriction endonuclease subunit S [Glaesserella parasuis]MDG6458606.1 restriction endonuclease subunit S [Glaesserella parasuis]